MRFSALATLLGTFAILAACGSDTINTVTVPGDASAVSCGTKTSCDGACVDPQSSHDNCGACGKVCGTGEACVAGACATSCPGTQSVCGGACVTTASDNANCGTCGTACPGGNVCSNGTCAATCAATYATCGATTSPHCAQLQNDNANCSACDAACASGEACQSGACRAACGAGLTYCSGSRGDGGADASDAGGPGFCASTQTDPANCGGCGVVCSGGAACTNGTCAPTNSPTPVKASGALTCVIYNASTSRNMAFDSTGKLYVAMSCGNVVHVATSTDGGRTFGAPVSTTMPLANTNSGFSLALGATLGTVHLAANAAATTVRHSKTTDGGATWSTPNDVGTNIAADTGAPIAVRGTTVYVAGKPSSSSGPIPFYYNTAGGVGAFTSAPVNLGSGANTVYFTDVNIDDATGDVYVSSEISGGTRVAQSTNGGVSFGTGVNLGFGTSYTDMALGGGYFYVFGSGSTAVRYPYPAFTPRVDFLSLPPVSAGYANAVGVDPNGAGYVAGQTSAGISLTRLDLSGLTNARLIALPANAATQPTVIAPRPNLAFVSYSSTAGVFVSAQVF